MKKRVLLHGGLHKTGTTTIQHLIRRNHARALNHGVFVPPPDKNNKEKWFGSLHGGLHLITKELLEGRATGTAQKSKLRLLLEDFEASQCHTLFLSSEGFSLLDAKQLSMLRAELATYDIQAVLFFRHPILHIQSWYCSRGSSKSISPDAFLWRYAGNNLYKHHTGNNLYGDIATRWLNVFGSNTKILRYENYQSVTTPMLELLELGHSLGMLDDTNLGRRKSLTPDLAILNHRLTSFFSSMSHSDYKEHIYNNVLRLGETEAYRSLKETYAPSNLLFSAWTQKAYLFAARRQLNRLEQVIEPPLSEAECYSKVIQGNQPSEAFILDLINLFGKTFLPQEIMDNYTD
ncbi:hypothetical protein KFU94_70230 [Chloroflexi bacterium TSY]|nr:hypothetical protein [Chloroflexi bacterium TSY]